LPSAYSQQRVTASLFGGLAAPMLGLWLFEALVVLLLWILVWLLAHGL
jgi:hypothetical protein